MVLNRHLSNINHVKVYFIFLGNPQAFLLVIVFKGLEIIGPQLFNGTIFELFDFLVFRFNHLLQLLHPLGTKSHDVHREKVVEASGFLLIILLFILVIL